MAPTGPDEDEDGLAHFPHLDARGNARMVDVTNKVPSDRRALARGQVTMRPATCRRVAKGDLPAGDVLGAARTAGMLAAKQTADLLPLCHPLLLGTITVEFSIGDDAIEVVAGVEAHDRTGVEMEALTACAIATLTIYTACKSLDPTMRIENVAVIEKSGGRSGSWMLGPDGTVRHTPATEDP